MSEVMDCGKLFQNAVQVLRDKPLFHRTQVWPLSFCRRLQPLNPVWREGYETESIQTDRSVFVLFGLNF